MDMILLDWTRMGKSYCLAGAVPEKDRLRIVRPLPARHRGEAERKCGWSPWHLDGYARWQLFELVGPAAAKPEPPHLEDLWVRSLKPRPVAAPPEFRRAILQGTAVTPGELLFGAAMHTTRVTAYLQPGEGKRSLTTLLVPTARVRFFASRRDGAEGPDVRVVLNAAPLGDRQLPVKDHHLLLRAEKAATDLEGRTQFLEETVRQMGETMAVRLGLSRAFPVRDGEPGQCWLMADGLFSLSDPQP